MEKNGEFEKKDLKFECAVPETVMEVNTWSSWSDCSQVCGEDGVRERTLNGELENEGCNVKICDVQTNNCDDEHNSCKNYESTCKDAVHIGFIRDTQSKQSTQAFALLLLSLLEFQGVLLCVLCASLAFMRLNCPKTCDTCAIRWFSEISNSHGELILICM